MDPLHNTSPPDKAGFVHLAGGVQLAYALWTPPAPQAKCLIVMGSFGTAKHFESTADCLKDLGYAVSTA